MSLNAGSTKVALAVQSSTLTHGQLVQQLGAVRSLQHLTSAGLAQQFVIAHAPVTGAKSVVLDLASTQQWRVIRHGAAIEVRGGKLVYGGLHTTDATGRVLPSRFVVTGAGPQIVVNIRGAAYPITIDPTWANQATPEATLISSDGTDDTNFGYAVALSGDDTTALVGAYGTDSSRGVVYVFHVASATDWTTTSAPTAILSFKSDVSFSDFGSSLALSADGTTALISAPTGTATGDAVYVYHVASESSWVSTSTPTATLFDGSGIADGFGHDVALSADGLTALIGALDGGGDDLSVHRRCLRLSRLSPRTAWVNTATPTATLTTVDYDFRGAGQRRRRCSSNWIHGARRDRHR